MAWKGKQILEVCSRPKHIPLWIQVWWRFPILLASFTVLSALLASVPAFAKLPGYFLIVPLVLSIAVAVHFSLKRTTVILFDRNGLQYLVGRLYNSKKWVKLNRPIPFSEVKALRRTFNNQIELDVQSLSLVVFGDPEQLNVFSQVAGENGIPVKNIDFSNHDAEHEMILGFVATLGIAFLPGLVVGIAKYFYR